MPASLSPKRLRLTAMAEQDLDEIAAYLDREDGPEVADRFADHLDAELTKLADLGHSGVTREWLGAGVRLHVIGNYGAYFRVTETDTIVLRVLHGRMDVSAIVFQPHKI